MPMARLAAGEDILSRRALFFRSLADETRLVVLQHLGASGECSAGDIARDLSLAPSTLSFHLTTLASAGLVTKRREGRRTIYAADLETLVRHGILEPGGTVVGGQGGAA